MRIVSTLQHFLNSLSFGWPLLVLGLGLTLVALVPLNPQGPFDARTYEPLSGVELEYSWSGALLEPAGAIGHALTGAPNPKPAAISTLAWVLFASVLWGFLRYARRIPLKILAAGGMGVTPLLAFLAYAGLYFIMPFPSWHPTTEKND